MHRFGRTTARFEVLFCICFVSATYASVEQQIRKPTTQRRKGLYPLSTFYLFELQRRRQFDLLSSDDVRGRSTTQTHGGRQICALRRFSGVLE